MIEYYEFTDNEEKHTSLGGTCFTIGKIYKINNPKDLEDILNFIDNHGVKNGFSGDNHLYFKPSTKEAFMIQEGLLNSVIKDDNYNEHLLSLLNKLNIK